MINVSAICPCGKDMMVEPCGEFLRLICTCGYHKTARKPGPKDTQPVPVVSKSMTEAQIHEARERLANEDSRDGFSGERTIAWLR